MCHCPGWGKETITYRLLRRRERAAATARSYVVQVDEIRTETEYAHVQRISRLERWPQPEAFTKPELACNVEVELPKLRAMTCVAPNGSGASYGSEAKSGSEIRRKRRTVDTPVNVVWIAGKARAIVLDIVKIPVDAAPRCACRNIERSTRAPAEER